VYGVDIVCGTAHDRGSRPTDHAATRASDGTRAQVGHVVSVPSLMVRIEQLSGKSTSLSATELQEMLQLHQVQYRHSLFAFINYHIVDCHSRDPTRTRVTYH
jgi:hypothetical protein